MINAKEALILTKEADYIVEKELTSFDDCIKIACAECKTEMKIFLSNSIYKNGAMEILKNKGYKIVDTGDTTFTIKWDNN